MARWYSWLVLAACAVITQSLPESDEYKIPEVPHGKRAQYYIQHDDGDFKYGYDTGAGAYESAVKMGGGDLTGFFGFNNALGENVRVDYTAGADGFKPRGVHLPAAPETAGYRAASSSTSQKKETSQSATAVQYSAGSKRTSGTAATYSGGAVPTKSKPVEEANINSASNLDGSYSFSYDNSDSSRKESGDAGNNVVGQYSFVAGDGQRRNVQYKAGSATGFVVEGDGIPTPPLVRTAVAPAAVVPNVAAAAGSVRQGYKYNAPATPVVSTLYNAPSSSSSSSSASSFSSATLNSVSGTQQNEPRGDASYSFKYQTSDSAREENADRDLNVRGSYSFKGDDGENKRVDYIAGSGIGFVATGSHLPVAPEVGVAAPSAKPIQYSAPTTSHDYQINRGSVPSAAYASHQTGSSGTKITSDYSAPANEPRGDASYSFQYQTGDSSRTESADSDLNVKGEYSFTGDDGQLRTVKYRAGSGTGFVAEGDHIPSDDAISPKYKSSSNYGGTTGTGVSQPSQYSAASVQGAAYKTGQTGEQTGVNIVSSRKSDGSYSFSYTNSDSSRSENADANNNVVGEYSFVADDGQNRKIRYQAGATTGFVADGDSIPSSPEFKSATTRTSSSSQRVSSAASQAAASQYSASQTGTKEGKNDASYSFSYNTGDSSRNEESDKDLNVKGSYSFTADDGIQRHVNYIAGSGTGFVAEGDHLPKDDTTVTGISSGSSHVGGSQVLLKTSSSASAYQAGTTKQETANVRSSANADGGYSFSYTNSDSSRSETGDAANNVVGQYSFIADDGQNRQVRYKAGAETGFVAEGDGIPTAPEVSPSLHSAAPAAVISSGHDISSVRQGYTYSAPDVPAIPALYGPLSPTSAVRSGEGNIQTGARGDASYSFKYDAGDSDREESADRDLNIKGQYSFVADDGARRKVNYIAGSGTGFVAQGDHLPVAPEATPAEQVAAFSSSGSRFGAAAYSAANHGQKYAAESPIVKESERDASYSFAYNDGSSTRQESANKNLDVKGTYSFVADDGVERKVDYIAGSGTGFVATGDHLPVHVEGTSNDGQSTSASATASKYSSTSHSGVSHSASSASVRSGNYKYTSDGQVIGNVLLRQYAPGRAKFGYVFTEI